VLGEWTRWLAWATAIVTIALTLASVVLRLATGVVPGHEADPGTGLFDLLPQVLFGVTGAVIAVNRPRNPIGWVLAAMALIWALQAASGYYALYAFEELPSLPGGNLAAIFFAVAWAPPILGLPAIFALFPSGRLISPRWSWILIGLIVPAGASIALAAIAWPHAGPELLSDVQNVELVEGTDALIGVFILSVVLLVVGGVISLVVRFRRAGGAERNQIKYLILAGIGLVASAITSNLLPLPVLLSDLFSLATFAAVPVAIGAAILRYRLYDIDRIINKTIVYLIVTGSTLAMYAAAVFIVGSLAAGVAGGELTVALATLAAASAFRPVLKRAQEFVDRSFYRRKYDSAKTIAAFGTRLRDEIDLDDLSSDLVAIVRTTMQPEHVSLWLRPGS
jgi:hypothetical protein